MSIVSIIMFNRSRRTRIVGTIGAGLATLSPAWAGSDARLLARPQSQPLRVAQADANEAQRLAFESSKELGTIAAWEAFLSNYPKGFYSDLARAYLEKLSAGKTPKGAPAATREKSSDPGGQAPSTAEAATAPAPVPAVVGPGTKPWYNETIRLAANENAATNTALVDAGGVQLTAYCEQAPEGPRVVPGLRIHPKNAQLLARLSTGLLEAESVTANASRIEMTFSDGFQETDLAATTPTDTGETTFLKARKPLAPDDPLVERLMAGETVTVAAEPFTAVFQLTGSRKAICSVLNRCDAEVAACNDGD